MAQESSLNQTATTLNEVEALESPVMMQEEDDDDDDKTITEIEDE